MNEVIIKPLFEVGAARYEDMSALLDHLQEKRDYAEQYQLQPLEQFTDIEVIHWFLYHQNTLLEGQGKSPRTIKEYEKELKQFITYLMKYQEQIGLTDIEWQSHSIFKVLEPRHIRKYQEWLKDSSPYVLAQQAKGKSGYSVATLTRKTTILKHFLQYLYKEKYITAPLHEGFKAISVRKDDRPNRDVGSIDMVRVLDAFVKTENIYAFSVIQLLVTTGIRNEELCKLCVEDVYTAVNGSSYLKIVGKGNKLRDVPLHPSVKESIHYYRKARGVPSITDAAKGSPLLPTSKGKAFSPSYLVQWLDKQFETIRDVLPCDFKRLTPHYFRHAFAIISHENGADIYDIMRSLGHENIETTMIYLAKVFEQEKHTSFNWTNNMSKFL